MNPRGGRELAATAWAYAQGWTARGLSLLIFFALARLLTPQDFGAFAIAAVVLALSETVVEQGLSAALIQRDDLQPAHLNAAFWGALGVGGVLAAVALLAAAPLARWFGARDIAAFMCALAPVFVLMAGAVVPAARLRRQLDYKTLAQRALLANLLAGAAAVVVALRGHGAWAFVANQWVYQAVSLIVLWRHERWRPEWGFAPARFIELLGFSGRVSVSKLLDYGEQRGVEFWLAHSIGLGALGQFAFANRNTQAGQQLLAGPIWDSAMGILSRLQTRDADFRRNLLQLLRWAALIAFPPLVFVLVSAPVLVPAVFGAQWRASVPCLQLLLALALLRTPLFLLGVAIQARGEARVSLHLAAVRVACSLGIIALLPQLSVAAVAAALLGGQLLSGVGCLWMARRLLALRALDVARALALPAAFCIAGGALVAVLERYSALAGWPLLLWAAAVYAALWCALVFPLVWRWRRGGLGVVGV
jgi:O-antigen/teichoic acid export membrane protein